MSSRRANAVDEVTALIHEYAFLLDHGDLDGVAGLFANAELRSTNHERVRRGALEARTLYDPVILYDDGTPQTMHQLTNVTVVVDHDVAHAWSYFTVLQVTELGLQPILAGEYRDRFAFVDGAWGVRRTDLRSAPRRRSFRPHARLNDRERHPADLLRLVLGSTIFVLGAVVARRRSPSQLEVAVFRRVNDLPAGLHIPLETVMQLGTAVAVVAVTAIALIVGRYRMALSAFVSGLTGIVVAHFMRETGSGAGRPLDLLTHVVVRGTRITGFGYPSGHTTTAAALVAGSAPYLPRWARNTAWTALVFVALARVYVGAHFPLDVVGGAALGLAIGAGVNLALKGPGSDPP